jgi:hypothetical protein
MGTRFPIVPSGIVTMFDQLAEALSGSPLDVDFVVTENKGYEETRVPPSTNPRSLTGRRNPSLSTPACSSWSLHL